MKKCDCIHLTTHPPTIADAIFDRIIHNTYKINLEGESQRKLKNEGKKPENQK